MCSYTDPQFSATSSGYSPSRISSSSSSSSDVIYIKFFCVLLLLFLFLLLLNFLNASPKLWLTAHPTPIARHPSPATPRGVRTRSCAFLTHKRVCHVCRTVCPSCLFLHSLRLSFLSKFKFGLISASLSFLSIT